MPLQAVNVSDVKLGYSLKYHLTCGACILAQQTASCIPYKVFSF